jgi:hypothetical protein
MMRWLLLFSFFLLAACGTAGEEGESGRVGEGERAALWYRWQAARPGLILFGGGWLFFWLLLALAPPRKDEEMWINGFVNESH